MGGLLTIAHGFRRRMLRPLVSMAPLLVMAALLWAHDSSKSYGGVWAQATAGGNRGFYATTCPNVEAIARSSLQSQFQRDPTAPAAMIRLLFHDCQVNGCDASILLDIGSDGTSELQSGSNLGIRRLDIIDTVKQQLESVCPQTVSCADIIVLAAKEAVRFKGGPDINVPLGRTDGFDTSQSDADNLLPSPSISVPDFANVFGAMGMTLEESVAILGAHTLGVSHCSNFVNRLYPFPDPNLDGLFANNLRAQCPPAFPVNGVAPLDTTSLVFDNAYYRDVTSGRGLLTIDSELGLDPDTAPIVQNFATSPAAFFNAFASAFIKLSSFQILTGTDGEVRLNCHTTNN